MYVIGHQREGVHANAEDFSEQPNRKREQTKDRPKNPPQGGSRRGCVSCNSTARCARFCTHVFLWSARNAGELTVGDKRRIVVRVFFGGNFLLGLLLSYLFLMSLISMYDQNFPQIRGEVDAAGLTTAGVDAFVNFLFSFGILIGVLGLYFSLAKAWGYVLLFSIFALFERALFDWIFFFLYYENKLLPPGYLLGSLTLWLIYSVNAFEILIDPQRRDAKTEK